MSMPPCGKPEECSYDPDVHKDIHQVIVYEDESGLGVCVSGTMDFVKLEAEDLLKLAQYWRELGQAAVSLARIKDEELTAAFLLSRLAEVVSRVTHPPIDPGTAD